MHNFPILYVEDEEYDVLFLKKAFGKAGITNPLQVVVDGQQAIDYLAGRNGFSDRQKYPVPGVVLLDLKLPHRSGFEVLEWIRQQPELRRTLVVVYSSSSQPSDIEMAYNLGANGYLVKQGNPDQLVERIKAFKEYWLVHNEPPCSRTRVEL